MKIFHASLEIVESPEIRKPNRTLDYGAGFYTTTDLDQAKLWVMRYKGKATVGYVNVYEIDMDKVRASNTLWFDGPSDEWIDFVDKNRNHRGFTHDYDYVYGPVANDRVYAAFALYESGVFNKEELIRELKVYKLVDQLLFYTVAALTELNFIEAIPVEL
ncbi:MAG: DUF3990 domain-containing protein [Bacteroidales bacterium]|nr:DUF3990 domain-containing protein [Candidatus Sodaliphilus limicaballi]